VEVDALRVNPGPTRSGAVTRVGGVILQPGVGGVVTLFVLLLVLLFAHVVYGKRGTILKLVFPMFSRLMR
jgi:hypothetical protein